MNKCTCVNSKNKPNDIKASNWVVENSEYTVLKLRRSVLTGEQFLELKEVQPDPPYGGYKASRFAFDVESFERLFGVELIPNEISIEINKALNGEHETAKREL